MVCIIHKSTALDVLIYAYKVHRLLESYWKHFIAVLDLLTEHSCICFTEPAILGYFGSCILPSGECTECFGTTSAKLMILNND